MLTSTSVNVSYCQLKQLLRHGHMTRGFFCMGIVKKRTVIHWITIKKRQHNGCCNLKVFIKGKTFAFGHRSRRHSGLRRHSGKYLIVPHLKSWKIFVSGLLSSNISPHLPLYVYKSWDTLHQNVKRSEKGLILWL